MTSLTPAQERANRVAAWTEELARQGYVIVRAVDLPDGDLNAWRVAIGRAAGRAGITYRTGLHPAVSKDEPDTAWIYEREHARRLMRSELLLGTARRLRPPTA
jgi:hypothetical protein